LKNDEEDEASNDEERITNIYDDEDDKEVNPIGQEED